MLNYNYIVPFINYMKENNFLFIFLGPLIALCIMTSVISIVIIDKAVTYEKNYYHKIEK